MGESRHHAPVAAFSLPKGPRVLFQRQFTDKLHDAIFDDIGFNADP
jgi:hypothetical protein